MAKSGGRYVLENGKRRLISRTKSAKRAGVVAASPTVVREPFETDINLKPQPAETSETATAKEAK